MEIKRLWLLLLRCAARHHGWGGGWSSEAWQEEGAMWDSVNPLAKLCPTMRDSRGEELVEAA